VRRESRHEREEGWLDSCASGETVFKRQTVSSTQKPGELSVRTRLEWTVLTTALPMSCAFLPCR
jgi:hypothetical protein